MLEYVVSFAVMQGLKIKNKNLNKNKMENCKFSNVVKYAMFGVLAVAVGVFSMYSGNDLSKTLKTAVDGYSGPVNTAGSTFGCNPTSYSWKDLVWCQSYGSTYDSHVTEAGKHAGVIVMFKRTGSASGGFGLPNYGEYYVTGNYGSSATGKNGQTYNATTVVKCPSGATAQYHSSSHHLYSPNLGEGFYDGNGHYWCELNGVSVDPEKLDGRPDGVQLPDSDNVNMDKLYPIYFPGNIVKYKKIGDSASYYKCSNGYEGPYEPGVNQYLNMYFIKESAKKNYYRCLTTDGSSFEAAVSDGTSALMTTSTGQVSISASLNNLSDAKNCSADYTTCQPSCAAGDSTCGGAGTYVTGATQCASNTYIFQTTESLTRYCASSPSTGTYTPPAPSWTISAPTNLRVTGTKTTGFGSTESVPVAADFAATGTGISYGSATLTVQIAQDTSFATAWIRPSSAGAVTAVGSSVNSYIDNFPATGTFYWRAKMALGTQESAWTSSPYGSFVVCASGKTWNGTSCITPTVATCALDIKLNDGKTTYTKSQSEYVNYTYSCTPVGTKAASVTVQVVKPDGTATTYNSGTNIDTASMGFSTSNLDAGSYVLRACLTSTCTSGVASVNFAITAATTDSNTSAMTLTGTIYKNGQYVDPATSALRNCVSPSYWMKEGPTSSGARGFHCMPSMGSNAPTAYDAPPTTCAGTLWVSTASSSTTDTQFDYCATSKNADSDVPIISADWKQIIWNDLGLKSYVSVNTPQSVIDAAKKACATTKPENASWANPNDFSKPDTVGVPFCAGTPTLPPTPEPPKQCLSGETCVAGSWCNMGQQCYYPDGKLTCTSNWNQSCPTGTKVCAPSDSSCIEPGSKGPSTGWCKNSMECFSGTGEKYCQPWSSDPMPTKPATCPAEYNKKCSPTDTKCIEPNTSGPVDGWCKEAMECYSKDGAKKFCQGWSPSGTTTAAAPMMGSMSCPAEYPKSCRPDDKNCIEIGSIGPSTGWCAGGGKQCYKPDGNLYCAKMDESCPADSKACRSTDTNCVEPGQYGSKDGWCGGSGTMQCYKKDNTGLYCLQVNTTSDPSAWEKAACPADTGRCRPDDKYCLDGLGKTGPSGSWCAVGMSKYKDDSTVTCVSFKDYNSDVVVTPVDKDKDACLPTTNPVYNPSSMECKMVATTCNVPKGWEYVTDGRVCKDGKLVNIDTIVDDVQSLIKYIKEKVQYLNDLEMQVSRVSEGVAEVRVLLGVIDDAKTKLGSLLQIVKTDKKTVKEEMKVFTESTLPQIEEKWAKLGPYIEAIVLKREVQKEIFEYGVELGRMGNKDSEYKSKLSKGIETLKGLLEALEVQVGTAREQILLAIKEMRGQLTELVKGRRDGQNEDSFSRTLAGLEKAAETYRSFIDEKGISDPKVIFIMRRFEDLLSKLRGDNYEILSSYISEKIGDAVKVPAVFRDKTRMLDEAIHMRDKIAAWLKAFGFEGGVDGSRVSFDEMLQHIDERIAQRVDEVIGKLSNKLELMLDTVTQGLTVKVAEMVDKFSEKFQEKATQALSNLTSVVEAHREAIAEAKSKIYDRLADLESAIEIAKADLGTFTLQPVRDSMEVVASTTWCGDNAENVQSKINSIGLVLETGEAEASDISQFEEDIAELNAGNTEECYRIGATAFRDAPLEEWYYPYAQYNYDHGLMMGYTNSDGERLGQLGVANPTLRIEALAMVMRIFGIEQGDTAVLAQGVPGVPTWGVGYVNGALNQGIAFDWKLAMDYPITRIETAKLFVATMQAIEGQNYFTPATAVESANKYGDVAQFSKDSEGALAVEALTDVGIFAGGGDGNFHPYDSLLRSEFATTNERLIETYGLLDSDK
jgi:hypothetical protein